MTTTVTFRLSDEEKERLEIIAEQKEMTTSQIIRIAIKEYLKNQSEKDSLTIGVF